MSRTLKAVYTIEPIDFLKSIYGLDKKDDITRFLSTEVKYDMTRTLVNMNKTESWEPPFSVWKLIKDTIKEYFMIYEKK